MSLQFRSVLNDDWTKHSPPLGVSFLNCFPLLFNRPVMSDSATPRTAACQTSHLPKFAQVHIHCIGDTIQLSHPLMPSSPSPSLFPCIRVFSNESTVCIRWQNYWSFSFNIRPSNEYSGLISFKTDWFDQNSQESSPALQFESINYLAPCLLYSPVLTTICGHWEDRNLDYTDLYWQRNVSAFQHTVEVSHSFLAKTQTSSDSLAAVTICSDFRAQEEEICHYFHLFPFYLPWGNRAGCHDLSFLIFSFKTSFSLSSFTLIKRSSVPPLSAMRVVSSTYLKLLIFLLPILILICSYKFIRFIKIFFVQFFSTISVLYCAHLWVKCSLDISPRGYTYKGKKKRKEKNSLVSTYLMPVLCQIMF